MSLEQWVEETAALTRPREIVWCDGSPSEAERMAEILVGQGRSERLNEGTYPNCLLHRSDPNDVARTEKVTFICTRRQEDAGPTNPWMAPAAAKEKLGALFAGAMAGRTMYVVPYLMGPPGSPLTRAGVEITDSPYVVASVRIMTRMGRVALEHIAKNGDFVPGLHSLGDLNPDRRFIMHFPEEKLIWSIGSGYGGNALLCKKCFALRIASWMAREQGWMAEHMLILGLEDPSGKVTYMAAAFPERVRQDQSGHDEIGAREKRLPSVDGGRRYLLDDARRGWLPARDQSRGGFFWRRAWHQSENQRKRYGGAAQQHDFHQYRDDGVAGAVVARPGRSGARGPGGLAGLHGGGAAQSSRTSQFAVHGAGPPGAIDFTALGRSGRRADLGVYFWGPAGAGGAAGVRIIQLAARRVCGGDDGVGNHGGRDGSGGRHAARSHGDAAVLRIPHGRLFRALAGDGPQGGASTEDFSCELVPYKSFIHPNLL